MKATATALSVTQYAARIDSAVRSVGGAVVEGEVQKLHRSGPGHLFFDLTDGSSVLSCKVWAQEARRLRHRPADGELVLARVTRPDLWKQAGRLSLVVSDLKLAGDGELLRRRRELIVRLRGEGLCDRERLRPLPRFPRAVGVISGRGSAGMSDVIRAIHARFPPANVVTCSTLVQGKAAPGQMIEALARLMRHPHVDVILIARGGGSVQDLACFDDEALCRAISACTKPVVCAIGHTPDDPVCNHVSHPAATPTHAPELVVPSADELGLGLAHARQGLARLPARIERAQERVAALGHSEDAFFTARERDLGEARGRLDKVSGALEDSGREVEDRRRRLVLGMRRLLGEHDHNYSRAIARHLREATSAIVRELEGRRERLAGPRERLDERVPRRLTDASREQRLLIARIEGRDFRRHGYVLAADAHGQPVRSAAALRRGARLRLNFRDGQAEAVVGDIKREDHA
jgi:exodeoxyribonuclease VII large subunit